MAPNTPTNSSHNATAPKSKSQWRERLLAARQAYAQSKAFAADEDALLRRLMALLQRFEVNSVGLYWPLPGEFSANRLPALWAQWATDEPPQWALPYAFKNASQTGQMHYRVWQGQPPQGIDECGIPTATGPQCLPEVVLVPCVGYSRSGLRLGYGGGYFDRWMSLHPEATAVGLAWSGSEMPGCEGPWQAHDQALACVVTEQETVADG
jgi:5-formyltetrahydrofolate cyclo-ligase